MLLPRRKACVSHIDWQSLRRLQEATRIDMHAEVRVLADRTQTVFQEELALAKLCCAAIIDTILSDCNVRMSFNRLLIYRRVVILNTLPKSNEVFEKAFDPLKAVI